MSKSGSGLFRSALPRGERHAFPAASDRSYSFRSALPRGERPLGAGTEPAAVEFRSALPRGERLGMLWIATIVSGFDPRSRAGSDETAGRCYDGRSLFRSALPRGERPGGPPMSCRRACFDPRSRAGSDATGWQGSCCSPVSIRAPARGATRRFIVSYSLVWVSIRAPARGATSPRSPLLLRQSRFDPRSRAGSDGMAESPVTGSQ